jgi:hypothetical protein
VFRSRAPNVIHETFDDEVIIVDLDTGTYFSVNQAGSDAWTLLVAGSTPAEIVDALLARYDGPRAEVERETRSFLDELLARDLVVPSTAPPAARPELAPPASRRPWTPPRLEPYTDMQDLLLLDPIHEVDEAGWPRARRDAT